MRKMKILSLFLLLALLLSIGPSGVMGQGPPSGDEEFCSKVAQCLKPRSLTKKELEKARQLQQSRLTVSLNVPTYNMHSSPWYDDNMETCDEEIGDAGCCLTSATMVFGYYGSSDDPGDVNTCMGNSACPWVFADGEDCSDNAADWDDFVWASYAALALSLNEGYPPMLQLRTGEDGEHWVVVKAVSGGTEADDFTAIDPDGGTARTLDYWLDDGWWMRVIAIYTPR
jgi:hypothetical protein